MMTDRSMDFLEKQSAGAAKALEVLREELPLQRFVGESLSQAVVEGEVALPGGLREETTVLSAEAMAVLERSPAQADRVIHIRDGRVEEREKSLSEQVAASGNSFNTNGDGWAQISVDSTRIYTPRATRPFPALSQEQGKEAR